MAGRKAAKKGWKKMALGETLKQARLSRGLTLAQVAAATQIPAHLLDEIEKEDFRRIAAPIYGKGFIRMYARFLGLDPQPLIEEYSARITPPGAVQPEPAAESYARGGGAQSGSVQDSEVLQEWSRRVRSLAARGRSAIIRRLASFGAEREPSEEIWTTEPSGPKAPSLGRLLPVVLLIALLVVIVASAVSARMRRGAGPGAQPQPAQQALRPVMDPPDPYFERMTGPKSVRK